jgi:hypothetical protein
VKLQGCIDAALPIILVIALAAGCCQQAVRREGPPPAQRSWCASWSVRTPEGPVDGESCVVERIACERAVARARQWGGVAGLSAISDCSYRTGGH